MNLASLPGETLETTVTVPLKKLTYFLSTAVGPDIPKSTEALEVNRGH